MKCWNRNVPKRPRPVKGSSKGTGKAGPQDYKDTHGMERAADNKVTLTPEWDGPSRVVETEK